MTLPIKPTEPIYTTNNTISTQQLKARGWTTHQINRLLQTPDLYLSTDTIREARHYGLDRIETAEATDEALQKLLRKKNSTRQVRTRTYDLYAQSLAAEGDIIFRILNGRWYLYGLAEKLIEGSNVTVQLRSGDTITKTITETTPSTHPQYAYADFLRPSRHLMPTASEGEGASVYYVSDAERPGVGTVLTLDGARHKIIEMARVLLDADGDQQEPSWEWRIVTKSIS